jgi:hypothetical protein
MRVAVYLILAIGLVAVAGWALQRFLPSAFSRYPGGIEELKRRGKIVTSVYVVAALMLGGLMSGIPLLFASALGLIVCIAVVTIFLLARGSRSRVAVTPSFFNQCFGWRRLCMLNPGVNRGCVRCLSA